MYKYPKFPYQPEELSRVKIYTRGHAECVSRQESIILSATGPTATIWQANKVFNGYIDPSIQQFQTQGVASGPVYTSVWEIIKFGMVKDIFQGIAGKPELIDSLALAQPHIIQFVARDKRKWITGEDRPVFFLSKIGSDYVVFDVRRRGELTDVRVHGYLNRRAWFPVDGARFVTPFDTRNF